jgi:hypothetical protein
MLILWLLVILAIVYASNVVKVNIGALNDSKTVMSMPADNLCTVSMDSLPSLAGNMCCLNGGGGALTASRRADIGGISVIVNPVSTYYLDACAGFCSTGVKADALSCNNGNETSAYLTCVNKIKPSNCVGLSMPVARDGVQQYYIQSAGFSACPQQAVCSN